jgi:Guanylate kinase
MNIKKFYGDKAISLFIQPPSIQVLRKRLESRATDTPEVIEKRIERASYELSFANKFDKTIINDNLEDAQQKALDTIQEFLKK